MGTLSKPRRDFTSCARLVEVVGGHHVDFDQAPERGVDIRHAFAHQFELECRAILREHFSVAIENQATLGGQGFHPHAVTL